MGYTIYDAGRTGPSANIGGSSPFHIDSKFSTSLGEDEARRQFEAKVRKYRDAGRNVEFSNQGVAGMVYNLDAPDEERAAMFRKAYGAHAPREGFYSLDYYAPKIGDTRWDKSAEGAPIYAVAPEGGRRETGTGDNYGFYSLIYDKAGNIISKVGHGDNRYTDISSDPMTMTMSPAPSTPTGDVVVPVKDMSPNAVNAEYDKLRMAGDIFEAEKFGMEQNRRLFG